MTLSGSVKNGQIELDSPCVLPDGTRVEIKLRQTQTPAVSEDPGCFRDAAPPRPPDESEREALRKMLSSEQFEALMDIADRGGPDVAAIARLRAASTL
jgi:hypothetical protein